MECCWFIHIVFVSRSSPPDFAAIQNADSEATQCRLVAFTSADLIETPRRSLSLSLSLSLIPI